jgi:hypothetical protein
MPNIYKINTSEVANTTTTSVTFTSIPSTYTHLRIYGTIAGESIGTVTNCRVYFNSDSNGANYTRREMYAEGTGSAGAAMGTEVRNDSSSSVLQVGVTALRGGQATSDPTNPMNPFSAWIANYTTTSFKKTAFISTGYGWNVDNWRYYAWETQLHWNSTSTITSITIDVGGSTYLRKYSNFTLYGITA